MKDKDIKTPLAGSLGEEYANELRVVYDNSIVDNGNRYVFFTTPRVPNRVAGTRVTLENHKASADRDGPHVNENPSGTIGTEDRGED
tara:strand:+ start:855 stop:1115 length:261 start_codon:yes stop_codon:yes gene_type:complete